MSNASNRVIREWIDRILERKGWDGTRLARESQLAPSTVLRFLNDPNHRFTPSLKTLQKIAEGSRDPIPRQVTEALGALRMEPPAEGPEEKFVPRSSRTVLSSAGPRRTQVKVKRMSSLPEGLRPDPKPEVVVACPPQLEGDDTAFAFYVPDSSLEPWLTAGALLYGTKRRDPAAGDMILVTDKSGRSRVRLLLDIDESGISMSKTHPPKRDERLGFDDIKDLALVAIIVRSQT